MKKRKHDYYDLEFDLDSDLDSGLESDLDSGVDSDLYSDLDSDLRWSSATSTDEERENFGLEGGSPSIIATDFGEFDNKLWGSLDRYINMTENVYSRLPFEDFFNLRTVCKDWYSIACKRLALKERLWKPFFTLYTKGANGRLHGMLSYNPSSKSWDWRRSSAYQDPDFQLVAVESLVFSYSDMKPPVVFHWEDQRTGTYYLVPPPPVRVNTDEKTIIGMSRVHNDGGEVGFRVLLGSEHFNTLVYDSKKDQWEIKPCRPKPKTPGDMQAGTGCVECNGRMYITTEHRREIFVYDFEKVTWSSIKSPLKWVATRDLKKRQHACLDTLGAWNGRVFDVTVSCPAHESYDLHASTPTGRFSVWELVDESSEHEWRLYDCMPQDLYAWLRSTKGFRRSFEWKTRVGHVTIHASFCGDYMLVYSWNYVMGEAGRFCLYDMAFKNWQKLQIPMGRVGFAEDSESEFIGRSFFESFTRSELIDPENEPYFLGSDLSDAELDLFLEENGYESDPGSDGAF